MTTGFPLAQHSQTEVCISLMDDGDETLDFAAGQLRFYVAVVTGAQLGTAPTLSASGPVIRLAVRPGGAGCFGRCVSHDTIELFGATPREVLFAVYDFVERHLGVVFRMPLDGEESLPRRTSVVIPCEEVTVSPVFREYGLIFSADDTAAPDLVDWMAKNRLNTAAAVVKSPAELALYDAQLAPQLRLRGMNAELISSFTLPAAADDSSPGRSAAEIGTLFAARPEVTTVWLTPPVPAAEGRDIRSSHCLPASACRICPQVLADIAARVADICPKCRLGIIAHPAALPHPVYLPDNICVNIINPGRCLVHAGEDLRESSGCAQDGTIVALRAWQEDGRCDIGIIEPCRSLDLACFSHAFAQSLAHTVSWAADHGAQRFLLSVQPALWGLFGLWAGVFAALANRFAAPIMEHVQIRQADLYGPAAPLMNDFHTTLEHIFLRLFPCLFPGDMRFTRYAAPRLLHTARELLGRALACAAGGEPRHFAAVSRVQMTMLILQRLYERHCRALSAARAGSPRRARLLADVQTMDEELLKWVESRKELGMLDIEDIRPLLQYPRGV